MKKTITAALALAVVLCVGCSSNLPKGYSPLNPSGVSKIPEIPEAQPKPELPQGTALATGLAVINSVANSVDAGDGDGVAEVNSSVVAVLVDGGGRIVDCKIDAVQSKISFTKDGKLLTDPDAAFPTKQELKEQYGMKKASGIGKEWYEQANALASYVTGRTMGDIKGIALTETSSTSDPELSASVTIKLSEWIEAIDKAVANARPMGARAGDKLGLGIVTGMGNSQDAGEADGLVQINSTYGAATLDGEGRITSCVLDGSQSNLKFDKQGKITTDLTVAPLTKNELKEQYGMKQASGIGREWYEQAADYAAYAVGKTVDALTGISVNDRGSPGGPELSSSVTISVGDFNACLEKAATSAK